MTIQLLASLRDLQHRESEKRSYFGIPELDALLPLPLPPPAAAALPQTQHQQPPLNPPSDDLWDPNSNPTPALALGIPAKIITSPAQKTLANITTRSPHPFPILEFISPPPNHTPSGSGKTSLIYLISALAILPSTFSSVALGGCNAAVVILDPLAHFNVRRLAEVCVCLVLSKIGDKGRLEIDLKEKIKETVRVALVHVHIFRPTSWIDMVEVLKQMQEYIFDGARHQSMKRRIHSIVLEDVDAFYWDIRSTSVSTTDASTLPSPLAAASTTLTKAVLSLSTSLSAAILLTSHSGTSNPKTFRAPIPLSTSWPAHVSIVRLAIRRVDVLRYAPGISVEEADGERGQRWEVVKRGRFECWKVVGAGGKENDGGGFVFTVKDGVDVE
ncbi:hypothetical protein K504DRAFT_461622 [Pleomassaria siparia CBS 279.74]|uniref:DNA recombination and repair protein Rad51-like C-terminal domain-containing protein n=1 Tax=Pleomassaria siparia CBS 279.74 TaxID=1314801 RepID=A0A6G1KJM0_9PLEO|nr:hypothetical protein K504DRAFT_461622 [Pleomassaria siparia CBS 279.74]